MTLKDLWELLKETWNAWSTHRAPRAGAALAYYTIFSLAPSWSSSSPLLPSCSGKKRPRQDVTEIQGVVGERVPEPSRR